MNIKRNYERVCRRIREACQRSHRDLRSVRIVAVSKYVDDQAVGEASSLGITAFGENRIQDARKKLERFPDLEWHFIGSLQTNKVKYCRDFTLIHSVDRWPLAESLNQAAKEWGQVKDVLVQVNVSGEKTKHGVHPNDLVGLVRELQELPYLNVSGLMTMAPLVEPELTRPVFRQLRLLSEDIREKYGLSMPVLSMGMSNDFEIAIEEGATLVRIGSALFGEEGQ